MTRRHGETKEYLVGEDLFVEGLGYRNRLRLLESSGIRLRIDGDKKEPRFRYGRMFRRPYLSEFRPEPEGLIALGGEMKDSSSNNHTKTIPSGYVYLGQFIDHDLSFNENTKYLPLGATKPEDEYSSRTPALDLDSLYGYDPDTLKQEPLGQMIYADDGVRLRVGETLLELSDLVKAHSPITAKQFPNDLPRGFDTKLQLAAIVDPRNDENLAVAQTHLAFIKFHNAVVEHFSATVPKEKLFETARGHVVKHYQWIILKDFLTKIIQEDILESVIKKGCNDLTFDSEEASFMPIEFSAAAFRLGHSMINEIYQWNRVFQSKLAGGVGSAHLYRDLFTLTGFGGQTINGQHHIPSSWIIDWSRFYDLTALPGINVEKPINFARKIDPSVVLPLMDLPPFPGEDETYLRWLPVRTLLRGRLLGVPAGQTVAVQGMGITPMSDKEICAGPHDQVLREFGLNKLTPLWYYILKEAEVFHGGERLGPVGSQIVAETFVALIKKSKVSILPRNTPGEPEWKPDLGVEPGSFSMPELIHFVQKTFPGENFINPLGP